jgi:hypothetical protein
MVGYDEPLEALQDPQRRASAIRRIVSEYPPLTLPGDKAFYRNPKEPKKPDDPAEYDSPPLRVRDGSTPQASR